jgi:hypothetical protein
MNEHTAYMPLDRASVSVTYQLDGTEATVTEVQINGMFCDPSVIAENILQGWEEELSRGAREDKISELEEHMPLHKASALVRRQAA